jgi:uncharacterized protein
MLRWFARRKAKGSRIDVMIVVPKSATETLIPPAALDALKRLGETYGIRNIRLFGSGARGEATAESDVDLLVDYEAGQSGFAFIRFCEEAEALLKRDVDVATVRSLHPRIRDRVLAEAKPL